MATTYQLERGVFQQAYPVAGERFFSAEKFIADVEKSNRFSWMKESREATIERKSWFGRFWQNYVAVPTEMLLRKALVANTNELSVGSERRAN